MRIGVLLQYSCQMGSLLACLRLLAPSHEIVVLDARGNDAPNEAQVAAALDCDALFLQETQSATPGPMSSMALVPRARCPVLLPRLAFIGFHPDCTYVHDHGQREMLGPMGPYNSALVIACHQEGLSPEEALALFNAYTYAHVGYYDRHASNCAQMQEDFAAMGFDFAALVAEAGPVFMHTINHPKVGLVFALAKAGLRRAGIAPADVPAPPDFLASTGLWPVYPEIAARLGLEGSDFFDAGDRRFDLPTMVQESYRAIDGWGDFHTPNASLRARRFLRRHVFHDPVAALTPDDVRQAYRFILGRACESEAVVQHYVDTHPTHALLRKTLMASQEFKASLARMG